MRLKSLLFSLGLGVIAVCSSGLENRLAIEDIPKLTKAEKLFVNRTDKVHVAEIDRKSGEKYLLKMAKEDEYEEAWIHAEYSNGRKLWLEFGTEESRQSITINRGYIKNLTGGSQPEVLWLSFYHYHPQDDVKDAGYDDSQTPSHEDFNMCARMVHHINKYCPYLVEKFDCRVVVTTGVWSIQVSKEIIDNEQSLYELNRTVYDIKNETVRFMTGHSKRFDYSYANMEDYACENLEFAEHFSNDIVQIKFYPKM